MMNSVDIKNLRYPSLFSLFPSHVVRSVSIIFEFPQGADYQNSEHPYVYNSWPCSLNLFVCHFWYFWTKKVDYLKDTFVAT